MARMDVAVGPFQILQPLDRGGNSAIWRGQHVASQQPVVIKTLLGGQDRADDGATFREEARAMARLQHPHVLMVLDYGVLSGPTAARLDVPEGSPYLVTELASGGDLRRWVRQPPEWTRLREALLDLLDGLAYAHAQDVLHRDIKPANVLRCNNSDVRPGLKLADFGLAWALEGPARTWGRRAGTPAYMAPEQVAGALDDYGPWTDLYAVGALVWEILQGQPPVLTPYGREWDTPRVAVPVRLRQWVERNLSADPADRFSRAADAAAALLPLGDQDAFEGGRVAERDAYDARTQLLSGATLMGWSSPTPSTGEILSRAAERMMSAGLAAGPHDPLPALPTLPPPDPPTLPLALADAGLGLIGLRSTEPWGRAAEKAQLWGALRRVALGEGPALALIEGAPSLDPSGLARWLCALAHMRGVAEVSVIPDAAEQGAARILSRLLRAPGSPDALAARLNGAPLLAGRFTEPEIAQIIEAATARGPGEHGEPWSVVATVITRLAGQRVALVRIEDLHQGVAGLDLVSMLLRAPAGTPLLVVATADPAALQEPQRARLDALSESVTRVPLGPLPPLSLRGGGFAGLRLAPLLAAWLEEATGGQPAVVNALLHDLAAEGALVPGPDGFGLAPGAATPSLDRAGVYASRLDRLLADRPPGDARGLALAAALGPQVEVDLWAAACRGLGVAPSPDLLDRLLVEGLAEPTPSGWAYAHPAIRGLLLSRSTGEDLRALYQACADALTDAGGAERAPGALGRLLLEAGRSDEAAPLLLRASKGAVLRGEFSRAEHAILLWERAMEGAPEHDPRRVDGLVMRGNLLRHQGQDMAMADDYFVRAVAVARVAGSPRSLFHALMARSFILRLRNQFEEAEAIGAELQALVESNPDPSLETRATSSLALLRRKQGRSAEALPLAARAEALAEAGGAIYDAGFCALQVARVLMELERTEEAAAALDRARARFESLGNRFRVATCDVERAGLALGRGDVSAADQHARAAREVLRQSAASELVLAETLIARVHMERGELREAREVLQAARHLADRMRWPAQRIAHNAMLILVCARLGDWEGADHHAIELSALLDGSRAFDKAAAEDLLLAAEIARAEQHELLAARLSAVGTHILPRGAPTATR